MKLEDIVIVSFLLFFGFGLVNMPGSGNILGLAGNLQPPGQPTQAPSTSPTPAGGLSPTPSGTFPPSPTGVGILTPTPAGIPTAVPTQVACPSTSSEAYNTRPVVVPPPPTANAQTHPDLNLAIRGYVSTTGALSLVDYAGATDLRAPQLAILLGRLPTFTTLYRVYDWDWTSNQRGGLISAYPVTLLGFGTTPGEAIKVPNSGYGFGDGNQVLVLYANENSITLNYTPVDTVANGYTIHVDGFCVDPNLLSLYRGQNTAGRSDLPTLPGNKKLGTANGTEVRVAIRDKGSFMDPRSKKDWWQGY